MSEGIGLFIKPWVKKFVASVALNGVPIRYPRISAVTGNWEFFDPIGNVYVDSGERAQGEAPEFRVENNTLQIKFPSDSDWVDLYEFSGGNAVQTEMGDGITVTNALGGWRNGDNIDPADNVFDVLRRLFNPVVPPTYTQPVLSLAGVTPYEREIGENIAPGLDPAWTQNDAGVLTQYRLSRGGTVIYTGTATATVIDGVFQLTANVTYQAAADYGQGPVKSDSDSNPHPEGRIPAGTRTSNPVTYTPQRKAFYGVLTSEARPETSDEIRSLSGELLNPVNGSAMTFQVPAGAWGACFAYPATLRTPQSIISQASGLDVKTGTPETAVSVEGANGYLPIVYRVFIIMGNIPYGGLGDSYILTI